jgi:dolichyl-phosphate-mannose--protein O-mannosyl transferase
MAPYIFSSFDHKLEVATLINADINNVKTMGSGFLISPLISFITRPCLVIVYAVASFFLLNKYRQNDQKNQSATKQNKLVSNWLFFLSLVTLLVAANFLIMTLALAGAPVSRVILESEPTYNLSGIAFALLPFALIVFFPQVLYGMPIASTRVKAKKRLPSWMLMIL